MHGPFGEPNVVFDRLARRLAFDQPWATLETLLYGIRRAGVDLDVVIGVVTQPVAAPQYLNKPIDVWLFECFAQ